VYSELDLPSDTEKDIGENSDENVEENDENNLSDYRHLNSLSNLKPHYFSYDPWHLLLTFVDIALPPPDVFAYLYEYFPTFNV